MQSRCQYKIQQQKGYESSKMHTQRVQKCIYIFLIIKYIGIQQSTFTTNKKQINPLLTQIYLCICSAYNECVFLDDLIEFIINNTSKFFIYFLFIYLVSYYGFFFFGVLASPHYFAFYFFTFQQIYRKYLKQLKTHTLIYFKIYKLNLRTIEYNYLNQSLQINQQINYYVEIIQLNSDFLLFVNKFFKSKFIFQLINQLINQLLIQTKTLERSELRISIFFIENYLKVLNNQAKLQ
ncbi:transmembrane protein, putative (macronuclear) [Tetrahymena thermophila SB210]|uniref:Transmembrane protein, putative n=1 Tax=Tetrahymena thermophila (strain SB210) TaxID=312017 RepID=W7WYN4_TETTS|nr:transmembrane protein, putative [Tetrahymena thermophila SB210]EWS72005.1 transmembrane protein, putative [Tetrahymena thermophila SB210]|eukprot:XP_012655461.1 transmembrane protein, putative [Tetrahymena thermophila SB210]